MAWTDIRLVTIDHTKCGASDDSNYPVLFTGTYATLAATGSGGVVTSGSGYDLGFYSDISGATKRNWELVSWNSATGFVEMYWLEPSVSHSADTADTYRCAGNASITTDQSNKNGVWDTNFKLVNHGGDGTTLDLTDSTSNGNTLTNRNSSTAVAGQVGGAVSYSGANQAIHVAVDSINNFTISCWVYAARTGADPQGFFQWAPASDWESGLPYVLLQESSGTLKFFSDGGYRETSQTLTANTWYFVSITQASATTWKYYLGATLLSTYTGSNGNSGTGLELMWGTGYSNPFVGRTDEHRYSNVVRSGDWVTKDYNNQYSPSTFYTMGSNLAGGGGSTTSLYYRRRLLDMAA